MKSPRKMKSSVSLRGNQLNWRNVTPDSDALSLLVGSEEGGFLSLEEIDGVELENCGWSLGKDDPRDVADCTIGERPGVTVSLSSKGKRKKNGIESELKIEEKSNNAAHGVKNRPSSCLKDSLGGPTKVEERSKRRKKKQRKNAFSMTQEGSREIVDSIVIDIQGTESRGQETESGTEALRALKKQRGGATCELVGAGPRVIMNDGARVEGSPCNDDLTDMAGWAEMRLHPKLERALSNLKFREPTPIQRQCIPAAAHKGRDVIGAAETGSGKTLAFGLPILQRLMEERDKLSNVQTSNGKDQEGLQSPGNKNPLRALIISPTRELALQICDHIRAAAKWTNVKVVPIVGGMSSEKQERLLKQYPEVIVGTPGRLWELMRAGETHLLELHFLSFFVLDEADRMVEKGHFKELQSIIDLLPNISRSGKSENNENLQPRKSGFDTVVALKPTKRRQTLVFSATLALPADFKTRLKRVRELPKAALKSVESVASLSERAGVKPDATIIDLTTSSIVAEQLSESVIECREEDKDLYLYYILKVLEGGRTIVFCSSIAALRRVAAILRLLSVPVWPLHAQMQQKARLKAMERFRDTGNCVLLATDVAARGIDVPDIRTVVHYQLPHSAEMYVHRSGRTARAFTDGISIAFVSPGERAAYLKLCRALSRPQRLQPFPINTTYLPAIEKRVLLALKLDKMIRKESQTRAQDAWLTRNSREIGFDLESVEDDGENRSTPSRNRRGVTGGPSSIELRRLETELRDLVSQPLKPAAFSNRYVTGSAMTPLLTKQLQDYARAKTDSKPSSLKKGRLVVIGQEQMEPLAALRLAAGAPCG